MEHHLLATRARPPRRSYYHYDPNEIIPIVALCLYGLTTLAHVFQTFRYRTWFLTVFIVAGAMQTFGYAARFFSAREVSSRGLYIAQFSLVVLAPLFTAAGNYILLGRLLERILPGGRYARTLKVPARWITLIFVASDILSFLLQGIGAAIISANTDGKNPKAQAKGIDIMLGGLLVQIAFFSFFSCAVVRFDFKTRKTDLAVKWRYLVYCIYLNCALIMARSVYRVIEFSQGWDGYLMSHEVYFYALEALPMLPCLVVFNIFHPAKYLPKQAGIDDEQNASLDGGEILPMEPSGQTSQEAIVRQVHTKQ